MRLASGDILTWLNSDDQLAPGALAAMALAFHQSGADMVAGVCELYRDGELVESHLTSCEDGELPLSDLLDLDGSWNQGQFFYQPEVMFTRRIWELAGAHVDESWHYSMDYELWLRFAAEGARLHVIGRPICRFRLHAAQKTHDREFLSELPKVKSAFEARLPQTLPSRRCGSVGSLRVLFFNDLGWIGGASIAHQRLAAAAAKAGHDVISIAVTEFVDPTSPAIASDAVLRAMGEWDPDVVVLGNLHGAGLPPDLVGDIVARWRTVFVLHDLWLVTGRCPYPGTCTRFTTGCDAQCPTAHEYPPLAPAKISTAWSRRREFLRSANLCVLANSDWTLALARRASPETRFGRLKLSVPLDVFRPRDKQSCRRELGIPAHRFVVVFSSASLEDPRKGLHLLRGALDRLNLDDVLAVTLGRDYSGGAGIAGVHQLGFISDPERLAMAYACADVYVGPSTEESFGQVFVEAAACGIPSVGFAVGGVPESIAHGLSGLVVQETSAQGLADAILTLYDNPDLRHSMSSWARLWAENEWSEARSYHSLFAGLQRLTAFSLAPKIRQLANPRSVGCRFLEPPGSAGTKRTRRLTTWLILNGSWFARRVWLKAPAGRTKTLVHKLVYRMRQPRR
jgi:glycosyltransferase involved in cell wall biosynthesis